jgi:hypothetical protein
MHDFHEYITGDIPSPVKQVVNGAMKGLEQHLDRLIYRTMGSLKPDEHQHRQVKVVDFSCLLIEALYFGTPGTVKRVFDIDWARLPEDFQQEVISCIEFSFPGLFAVLQAQTDVERR